MHAPSAGKTPGGRSKLSSGTRAPDNPSGSGKSLKSHEDTKQTAFVSV
jgi:hypothetical protein